jgi:hypothetical protein
MACGENALSTSWWIQSSPLLYHDTFVEDKVTNKYRRDHNKLEQLWHHPRELQYAHKEVVALLWNDDREL